LESEVGFKVEVWKSTIIINERIEKERSIAHPIIPMYHSRMAASAQAGVVVKNKKNLQ